MAASPNDHNLSKQFLGELTQGNWARKFWFLIDLVLPLALPISLLRFWMEARKGQSYGALGRIVQVLLVFIAIVVAVQLKVPWPSGYLAALLVNLLMLLLIVLSSSYDLDTEKALQNIQEKIDSNHREVMEAIERILGHKVWAGKKTYDLLNSLLLNSKKMRAKWLVVNFLSEIVEDAVPKETPYFEIVTTKEWDVCKYSHFLARNMTYAESVVWWLVDPHDFFNILLPEFIAYTLACSSFASYGEPSISLSARRSPDNVFRSDKYDHVTLQKICASLFMDVGDTPEITSEDETVARHQYFRKVILNIAKEFGLRSFLSKPPAYEKIQQFFDVLLEKYIEVSLPHIKLFQDARPKGPYDGHNKLRVVFFGSIGEDLSIEEKAKVQIASNWPTDSKAIKTPDLNWPNWPAYVEPTIVKYALRLFAGTCGGDHRLLFACTSSASGQETRDAGVFDFRFLVKSKELDNNNRRVEISYWPNHEPEETMLFRQIIDARKHKEKETELGVSVVDLTTFLPFLLSYLREFQSATLNE